MVNKISQVSLSFFYQYEVTISPENGSASVIFTPQELENSYASAIFTSRELEKGYRSVKVELR